MHKVVVIVEPDGLGLLPGSNCGGPTETYPYTDAERYEELNYAVDTLESQPNALVYLDGHVQLWLNLHDISTRLMKAGVQNTQGFFLNLSNFQFTSNPRSSTGRGSRSCIARLIHRQRGAPNVPNQTGTAGLHPAMIADLLGEWTGGGAQSLRGVER